MTRPRANRGPASRATPGRRRRRATAALGNASTRLSWGFGAVCTLLLVVTVRLVDLQGIGANDYARRAAAERLTVVPLHAARGSIVDRFGVVLAYTADAKDIVADPSQVNAPPLPSPTCTSTDKLGYAMRLAPLTGVGADTIATALSQPGQYAMLARAIAPGQAAQIEAMNLCGIYVQNTSQRLYPGGAIGANVVGLVQSDGSAAAGIEQEYDALLHGTDGTYTYERTATGSVNPAGVNRRVAATNGGAVRLTLSQDLQFWVQTRLDAAVRQSGARSGQVVVMTKQGQVLAMSSTGTFDPSNPHSITATNTANPPVQNTFEPGSVNKIVTFSAALDHKLITPTSVLKVPDAIDMGGVTVHDAWWHPTQKYTATGILAESSNVGTLKIAQRVGPTTLNDYLHAYGLGAKTGIELPAESGGILHPMSQWSSSTFANLPIGQGVAMTALQMTGMYQAVANDGVRIPPRIVAAVTQTDGTVQPATPPAGVRVTTPETAHTLRTMFESVMLPGGTGTKAAIAGYRIAGKTGTAQQPDPRTGRYSDSIYWDTYAGFAPADNPAFVVGIMIDNPAHGLHGGDVAAPLFREIATYQLQHERIAPTGSKSRLVPLEVK